MPPLVFHFLILRLRERSFFASKSGLRTSPLPPKALRSISAYSISVILISRIWPFWLSIIARQNWGLAPPFFITERSSPNWEQYLYHSSFVSRQRAAKCGLWERFYDCLSVKVFFLKTEMIFCCAQNWRKRREKEGLVAGRKVWGHRGAGCDHIRLWSIKVWLFGSNSWLFSIKRKKVRPLNGGGDHIRLCSIRIWLFGGNSRDYGLRPTWAEGGDHIR